MVAATASVIERLPPHNMEAEQSVLGSLLIDRDAIIRVASFLRPEDFYSHANELIYRAILDLYNRREPTDFVTLSDELQRRTQYDEAGGLSYLSSLLTAVPTAVHVEFYARIVERASTLRRLIDAGTEIVGIGFRDGVETEVALDEAERAIYAVSQRRTTKDFVSMGEVLDRFFDQIDYLQQHRGEVVGVATGFSDLDQLTGGLQRSDLIIVAARPSMGKTSLALGMAYGAALGHQKTVGIFSLEMSAEQLVQRILSMETGVDTHHLRLGLIGDNEWDRISRAFGRLSEAPIFIDDSSAASHHGHPLQVPSPPGRAGPRHDHRRLPATDDRPPQREPGAGDLRDLARAEGAGARAERAGGGPLPALPRRREPRRPQTDALGFAGVGLPNGGNADLSPGHRNVYADPRSVWQDWLRCPRARPHDLETGVAAGDRRLLNRP